MRGVEMNAVHIVVAMKPIEGNFADNAIDNGVAGLNIDGSRIETKVPRPQRIPQKKCGSIYGSGLEGGIKAEPTMTGRWPANLMHDGSEEVTDEFPDTGKSTGGRIGKKDVSGVNIAPAGEYEKGDPGFGDEGSAARFFKECKA
jgi:site-specific DNA-methyltransferase (adenine-specific)